MTLNQIIALAGDATFQGQCRAAALNFALTVIGSQPTANNLVDTKRYTLAGQVLINGCSETELIARLSFGLAATPGFSAIINDSGDQNDAAIQSAIQTEWSNLSGVTGADVAGGAKLASN